MKKLLMAAYAFAALCVPASAYTSRKIGFIEFEEFADLTNQRNTMNHNCTVFSGDSRCIPVNQTITSDPYGSNCYGGGLSLDTEQLTVLSANTNEVQLGNHNSLNANDSVIRATPQLTVHSATTNEVQLQTHINGGYPSTSTIGTDEFSQVKARLA
jgi:hypothetical protein